MTGSGKRPMTALDRTIMTLSCRDSDIIPKVPEAGKVIEQNDGLAQVMHNGCLVKYGGYHGDWMAHVIRGLQGHHEPQEELIFYSLIRYCRNNTIIVELGSFWAYYSIWYLSDIPGSRAVCIEPDSNNMEIGRQNAILNNCADKIKFLEGWVGGGDEKEITLKPETSDHPRTLKQINMDVALSLAGGGPIEILHMDVQGAEEPFLTSLRAEHISQLRFLVISTHHHSISGSKTTHTDCLELLMEFNAHILVEHSVEESFSGDGLIVASFAAEDEALQLPGISRNAPEDSLFRGL